MAHQTRCSRELREEVAALVNSSDRLTADVARSRGVSTHAAVRGARIAGPVSSCNPRAPTLTTRRSGRDGTERARSVRTWRSRDSPPLYLGVDAAVTAGRFAHDHRAEHGVSDLCRAIDVPRSTYFSWLGHQPRQRERVTGSGPRAGGPLVPTLPTTPRARLPLDCAFGVRGVPRRPHSARQRRALDSHRPLSADGSRARAPCASSRRSPSCH